MLFGLPSWPPPRWASIAASGLSVFSLLLIFLGAVGAVVLAVLILVLTIIAANRRLGAIDPDERFRNSRPED
jgi:uncharacterized membrane protein required for colicin V production